MVEKSEKTIGELNGKWQLFFKIMLATFPFAVLFNIWVVMEIQDIAVWRAATQANRFTQQDGRDLQQQFFDKFTRVNAAITDLRLELQKLPSKIPPPEVTYRLSNLESAVKDLVAEIKEIRKGQK